MMRQCGWAVAAGVIVLMLVGWAGPAMAGPQMRVAYAAVSSIFAGVWLAHDLGYLERHGLKAQLIYISSGGTAAQALIGGDLEMSIGASNAVISAQLGGAPIIAIGSVNSKPAMSLYVRRERTDIARVEDLRGKTLGITRFGSSTDFVSTLLFRKYGIERQVKVLALGGVPEMHAGLQQGKIDAMITSPPVGPFARHVINLADMGVAFSMDYMAVTRDYLRRSPDTVERFFKGYIEGIAALRQRKEQAIRVIAKYLRSEERAPEGYEYAVTYLARVPRVEPETVYSVLDVLGKGRLPLEQFADNTILDKIEREGFVARIYREGR
ncbi:MAG: ABC transporter substrate-binding protein [Deltaproteobacteria bacterium]|nr:ABC transporter substrate-binding protein [Deltaproteobacteria bacterium]